MFVMIFASALWFFADGYWVWPAEAQRHAVFKEMAQSLIADGKAKDEKDIAVLRAWERLAKERDWKEKVPKERTYSDIAWQRRIGWGLTTIATVFATWVALQHRKSVRAEGDWVRGAEGQRVNLNWIVEVDRRKWAKLGIAYAIYESGGRAGAPRKRLTLDDHKFVGAEAIILEAERRIAVRKGGDAGGGIETTNAPTTG